MFWKVVSNKEFAAEKREVLGYNEKPSELGIDQRGIGNSFDTRFSKPLHPVGFILGIIAGEEEPFGITLTSQYVSTNSIQHVPVVTDD